MHSVSGETMLAARPYKENRHHAGPDCVRTVHLAVLRKHKVRNWNGGSLTRGLPPKPAATAAAQDGASRDSGVG